MYIINVENYFENFIVKIIIIINLSLNFKNSII